MLGFWSISYSTGDIAYVEARVEVRETREAGRKDEKQDGEARLERRRGKGYGLCGVGGRLAVVGD
jgi:hypothetical protein